MLRRPALIRRLSRRSHLAGVCFPLTHCRSGDRLMSTISHRPASTLPSTKLNWLSLRDHFIATVGPRAGEGCKLGPLLVLADATFAPHSRFPRHPHREMEILSIVIDGALSHHGDQAHGASLGPRSAQLLSARNGIMHAEGNDTDSPTRMLQLWFAPDRHGGEPAYFSRRLQGAGRELIAGDEVMPLRADARVWWLCLPQGVEEELSVERGRQGYLLALSGPMVVDAGQESGSIGLSMGDGAVMEPGVFRCRAEGDGHAALWVDVPSA
jgi:redox-sensitive bicupin YhaK (pirin superfamily)